MKHTYLAKLYRYSKTAFALAMMFILFYVFLFLKKMDMTVFAYNGMFAFVSKPKKHEVCAIKFKDQLLPISKRLWWKKDFLESNVSAYSNYIKQGKRNYLDDYIQQKVSDIAYRRILLSALTPGEISPEEWAKHYITFLGEEPRRGEVFEIVQYELTFLPAKVLISDSVSIYKSTLQ